jgi:hypothetical protein
MDEHALLTKGEELGSIGMVWMILLVAASPVVGHWLYGGEWGAMPTLGLLAALGAIGKLVLHYTRGPRRGSRR